MKILGLGEVMIQLNPVNKGPLRHSILFERHVAGSEANVIVGMSRLGFSCGFLTVVGDDEFGKSVISTLRSEGVDTNYVKIRENYPTAVYFVQRGFPVPGKTTVFYYRKGSAFSTLSPDDVEEEIFQDVVLFHMSGITPALSNSCKEAALKAFEIAKENGVKISFDTNIRKKLLPTPEKALDCLKEFIDKADYLITGLGDLNYIFPNMKMERQLEKLANMASCHEFIVVKMGKEGACVFKRGEIVCSSGFPVEVVDELGAGDAFDAAFLASILLKRDIRESLKLANAAGALVVGAVGDIEPLPSWQELEDFISFQEGKGEKLMR